MSDPGPTDPASPHPEEVAHLALQIGRLLLGSGADTAQVQISVEQGISRQTPNVKPRHPIARFAPKYERVLLHHVQAIGLHNPASVRDCKLREISRQRRTRPGPGHGDPLANLPR